MSASLSVSVDLGGPTEAGRWWVRVAGSAREGAELIPHAKVKTLHFVSPESAAVYAREQLLSLARGLDPRQWS